MNWFKQRFRLKRIACATPVPNTKLKVQNTKLLNWDVTSSAVEMGTKNSQQQLQNTRSRHAELVSA